MEHCSKQSTTYLACEMPIMKNAYLLQQELTVPFEKEQQKLTNVVPFVKEQKNHTSVVHFETEQQNLTSAVPFEKEQQMHLE